MVITFMCFIACVTMITLTAIVVSTAIHIMTTRPWEKN